MERPSFLEVKAITDTLPIGFYAERRINAVLDEHATASQYNPKDDNIVISYRQIVNGLDKVTDESKLSTLIRSNFYHEVSHAILTPKNLRATNPRNIVEDERIEHMLKDFYYGVDFEDSVYTINGLKKGEPLPTPTDSLQAFYTLVRFHKGKKKWRDRVKALLKRYSDLNRNATNSETSNYGRDIDNLYEEFADKCETEGIEKVMGSDPTDGEGDPSDGDGEADGDGKKSKKSDGEGGSDEKGDSEGGKGRKSKLSEAESKALIAKFQEVIDADFNYDLHKGLELLFSNFCKKNSKGSSTTGHSGVLNPRRADAVDYRIFDRASTARGSNPFGSIHLNLFIDVSGSFSPNDYAVNTLLKSLAIIERKYHNFTFDVVTVGPKEVLLPKENRYINSRGGNHLSRKIFDIFRVLQKPQTYNYNIIMFDGDAYFNDVHRGSFGADWIAESGMGFRAFAHHNCTIISDYSNHGYIEKYCPSTRTIYTNDFVHEFIKNILDILQIALA